MRHKARLKRLEADVRWLWTDGVANWAEGWFDFVDKKKQLEDYLAAHPEAARKAREAGYGELIRLPPVPAPSPRPEEPREARRLEGPVTSTVPGPTLRDASLRDAPQGEVVGVEQGDAKESPRPEEARNARRLEGPGTGAVADPGAPPHPYDPPEHMQIRPVTWRLRTAEDDWDDDDDDILGPYQTVTEYDPLDDE